MNKNLRVHKIILALIALLIQTQVHAQQEINVQVAGTNYLNQSTFDFGSTDVGTPKSVIFTIQNLGNANLTLTGSPLVAISYGMEYYADIMSTMPLIAQGDSTQFTLTFNPYTVGTGHSDTLMIYNDDSNEPVYTIMLKGTGTTPPAPEVNLTQGSNTILTYGNFDFGNIGVGSSSGPVTFTIENLGPGNLTLFGEPLIGIYAGTDFMIDESSTSYTIFPGGFTTFNVTFNPTATGLRNDTLFIYTNDNDEDYYPIILSGTGTIAAPEVNIKQGSTNILSNGNFDFGSSNVGASSGPITFTIENIGTDDLMLPGTPIIASFGSADFVIDQASVSSTIIPGAANTFTVSFNPSASGPVTDTLMIFTNDSDENFYSIILTGTGTIAAPEVNIKQGSTNILSNGNFDLGSTNVGASSGPITFTIENIGTGDLILPGTPIIASFGSADFVIDQASVSSTIIPGAANTFTVSFNPSAPGPVTDTLMIFTNDPDEDFYLITLSGTGIDTTPASVITSMHIVGNEYALPNSIEKYKVEVPTNWNYTYTWTYSGNNVYFFPGNSGPEVGIILDSGATSGKLRCTAYAGAAVYTFEEIDITINNIVTDASKLAALKCPVGITNCPTGYIDNFTFHSIKNISSGCSNNGYTDYTRSTIVDTLLEGGVYSASLNIPNPNGSIINNVGMWVDYNNDGDFSGSDEFVATASGTGSEITLINIVFKNKEGYDGPKRLRVRSRPTIAFAASESCPTTGEQGETEDYMIVVNGQDILEAPQIITPNEDGKNDFFVIRGINPSAENKLTVFDRVGAVKYSTSNYENTWSGTSNGGEKLSPGTYYFVFTNDNKSIKGFLEIRY